IDALFIDAIHSYEEVHADFHHYLPFLTKRARVAFHDFLPERTAFPGVRQFIEEELLASGEWRWDDFRGALLTIQRVRRSRAVIEHNQRCLEAARERIRAIARQQEPMRKAG
ncbi:MAG TPA: class I SAM-dependent methyltransferase, partial [Gemmata sp.]|nr:class I SAM-dependent methyltransferase [Gemmata sp.]